MPSTFARLGALPMIICVGFAMAPGAGAATQSPFHEFVGQWTGSGEITASDGRREAIRCKAHEAEEKDGAALDQTIVCASQSYRLDITSYVEASGDAVQGNWNEATRQVSGHLNGQIGVNEFEGRISGPSFTAEIALSSNGRKQGLDIKPSAGDISEVHVEFRRQG